MGVIGATVVGGAYCTWPSCVVMSHLMRPIMLPKKPLASFGFSGFAVVLC